MRATYRCGYIFFSFHILNWESALYGRVYITYGTGGERGGGGDGACAAELK